MEVSLVAFGFINHTSITNPAISDNDLFVHAASADVSSRVVMFFCVKKACGTMCL
jgi:hypothetical protein